MSSHHSMPARGEDRKRLQFVDDLCQHLSEEGRDRARERFWRYVDVVHDIYVRLENEKSIEDTTDDSTLG